MELIHLKIHNFAGNRPGSGPVVVDRKGGFFKGNTMENFQEMLDIVFAGNTLRQYGIFLLIIAGGLLVKRFLSRLSNSLLYQLVRKRAGQVSPEQFHQLLRKPVGFILMMGFVFIAFTQLQFPGEWDMAPRDRFGINMILFRGYFVLLYAGFIWAGLRLAEFLRFILLERAERTDNKFSLQVVPFFVDSIKLLVVIFGVLVILGSVFGINVGTLVAGLGIGGLAVALAAKESLENLFGSITIFLDKPFVVGDMVTVAGITGVVEQVGFRSTRIRTLDKSYVTLPNRKMIEGELDNLSLRTYRRANFVVGLTYNTSIDQMKAIVRDIQDCIDQHPNTNQEGRVRFKDFGHSSLDIMVMFFVDTMDWTTYLDVKQEINYRIVEIVHGHKAQFAFPSTSVYIEKGA
jgi:MscS family membrane protein